MRIVRRVFVLACVLSCAAPLLVSGQPKYGVKVGTVKPAALATARTYSWRVTRPSFNKKIDAMIVAAIDRELVKRGLTKAGSGPGDVAVTYASVSRTDVNTKDAPKEGASREFDVGTLIVDLTQPTSREMIFQVRGDAPIQRDLTALEGDINAIVTAMFEKYPAAPAR